MSWSSQKEKRGHLLYRLFCPKRIFLTFVFYLGVQYIEYTFRIYILSHIKKQYFAHFFLLVFKVVENLHCIVNYNVLNIFINFRQHLNGLENCNRIFFFASSTKQPKTQPTIQNAIFQTKFTLRAIQFKIYIQETKCTSDKVFI